MEDVDDLNTDSSGVQLGLVRKKLNPLFKSKLWKNWDGGKVGGHPIWLDPNNRPTEAELTCKLCLRQLTFLLQLYCPLDEPENAFHRCLYIFICRKRDCVLRGSVKCFRSQLGRQNPHYDFECPDKEGKETMTSATSAKCVVCGNPAPLVCARCKAANYCGKEHQKSHWATHKPMCKPASTEADPAASKASCFKEYGIEVCEEELADPDEKALPGSVEVGATDASAIPKEAWENTDESGEPDEDADLTQNDFNDAAGIERVDELYDKFLTRIRRGDPGQVIRYSRWPAANDQSAGPLPISAQAIADIRNYRLPINPATDTHTAYRGEDPAHRAACMTCRQCSCELRFEFQVMPQLLYYLGVDKRTDVLRPDQPSDAATSTERFYNPSNEDIDFGTLDVYTCPNSCSGGGGGNSGSAAEESVLVVPPASKPTGS